MLGVTAFHFRSSDYLAKIKLLSEEDVADLNAEYESNLSVDDFSFGFIKNGTNAGLTFIEPLYTGGRINNYSKLADLQVEARNLQRDVADDQIVMSTEFLYYKILELHATDKMLDAMERELKNIHQDAVNIYQSGIVNKNNVLSVELDWISCLHSE